MISEFEQRLAGVLGPRLSGAFKNKVQVAPGAGNRPRMLVGVTRAEHEEIAVVCPDFCIQQATPVCIDSPRGVAVRLVHCCGDGMRGYNPW